MTLFFYKLGPWPLAKVFLDFEILTQLPILNLASLALEPLLYLAQELDLTLLSLILMVYGMYYCIYRQYHLTYQTTVICLRILFFKFLINLSTITGFPSLCVEYFFI